MLLHLVLNPNDKKINKRNINNNKNSKQNNNNNHTTAATTTTTTTTQILVYIHKEKVHSYKYEKNLLFTEYQTLKGRSNIRCAEESTQVESLKDLNTFYAFTRST